MDNRNRALGYLGLARRAGRIAIGEEPVGATIRAGHGRLPVLAQDAAELPGYLQFSGTLPETLASAFSGGEWADDKPVTGYVFTRFDKWSYANVIMEGDTGRSLCCLFWADDHWELTASSAAIPQDGTPVLEIEELEWYATEDELDQFNVGYQFTVYFEDSSSPFTWFRWFCGANGWQLQSLIGYQKAVSVNRRMMEWDGKPVYNTQEILLDNFVLADFPTTYEAALALAQADPEMSDTTAGITCYTEEDYADYDRSDVVPAVPVYESASSARQTSWMFDHTEVAVKDEKNGFVLVSVGDLTVGWIPRNCVMIGLERAPVYISQSSVRVLGAPGAETEPIYDAPGGTVCGAISTRKAVGIAAMSLDGSWTYVFDRSAGVFGWLPGGKAGLTDNYATCVVFNDQPENRLHLRAAPSRNAESFGKYYTGVTVDMLWQEKNVKGWRKVSVAGVVGWMNTDYLSFASNGNYSGYLPPLRKVTGATGGEGANMREAADKNAAIIRRLPNGTPAEIIGVSGEWGHIRLKDGTFGWMQLRLLGGEPEKADSWTFSLLQDVMAESVQNFLLPAGTKVNLQERPAAQWYCPNWREADYDTVVYGVPEEIFVYTGDIGARIPPDAIDCGW